MDGTTGWEHASSAPPTPGYDYQQNADGIWWARDQTTGALHWYDSAAGSWRSYEVPSTETDRPAFPYARFWERFGAFVVDLTITGAVGYAIGWLLGATMLDPDATVEELQTFVLISQGIGVVLGWLYYALMESSSWQATVGKKMVGLQVTDTAGDRIGFGKATGRHFAKFLSGFLAGIGFLMIVWDDKKQGLHDRAAGTLVLKRSLNTLDPHLPVQ